MKSTNKMTDVIELRAAVGRLMYSNQKSSADYDMLINFIEKAAELINVAAKCMDNYGIKDISTLEYILDQYQKVIVNITNGRMSYLTYPAEAILSVASDIYNEDLEKAINDAVTDRVAYINGGKNNGDS